jgi:hypothetical protein
MRLKRVPAAASIVMIVSILFGGGGLAGASPRKVLGWNRQASPSKKTTNPEHATTTSSPTTTTSSPTTTTSSPTTTTEPPTTTTAPAATLKPRLAGLIDISGNVPLAYQGSVQNVTVRVLWSDLEPTPGVLDTTTLDAALKRVPASDHVLLRLMAGIYAPAWAKNLGGAPFAMTDPYDMVSGSVGRWWLPDYINAWRDFNLLLAARYDADPQISEVTISGAMTIYAEPFMRGGLSNQTALLGAGFTETADLASEVAAIDSAAAAWHQTRISLALNPYQSQFNGTEVQVTLNVATYGRRTYGDRFVVENNSLRWPSLTGAYTTMYNWMAANLPAQGQTATLARIGDLTQTLLDAAAMHMGAVELPGGYINVITPAALAPSAAALAANAV